MKDNSISPAAAVGILLLLTLLVFHGVIFRAGVVYGKDTIVQGYPLAWFQSQPETGGAAPGWFPHMMSGFAWPPSAPAYPTDLLFYVLPLTRAITWRYLLHSFAGALLMYLMLRKFGRSSVSSLVGGMAFGFSAFFISKVYAGHGAAFWSGIWIPVTLLLLDRTIETRRARFAVFTGGLLGLQTLGGHPQYVFYTVLALFLYALWRIVPQIVGMRPKTPLSSTLGSAESNRTSPNPSLVRRGAPLTSPLDKGGQRGVEIRQYRLLPRYIGLAAVLALFTFLISAPYLLPFMQMTALSNRGGGTGYEYASSLALYPAQMITALAPSFWGNPAASNSVFGALYWDGAMFIGVVPLVLAIVALFGVKDPRARYFKALAIISLLIALGDHTPVFKIVYLIPGFDMIRAPSKILFLYTFATAALAAYGLDLFMTYAPRLYSARRRTPSEIVSVEPNHAAKLATRVVTVSFGAMAGVFLILLLGHSPIRALAEKTIYASKPNSAELIGKLDGLLTLQLASVGWGVLFVGVAAAAVVLVMRRIISARTAAVVIAFLTFIDLSMYADPLLYTTNARKEYTSGDRAAIKTIQADTGRFRVLPMGTGVFHYAQGIFDDIESVNGYYPISIARYARFVGAINGERAYVDVNADVRNPNSKLVDMLNVKYVLSEEPITGPNLEEVYSGRARVYRNTDHLPRISIVHEAVRASSEDDAFEAITRPDFDPRQTIVIENSRSLPRTSVGMGKDHVNVVRYDRNDIRLIANLASPGYVLLSEVNYPGWQATIDGKPIEVLQANYLFRAVHVPKGRHDVRFTFVQPRYRIGFWLFTASVVFIAAMLLMPLIRREHSRDNLKSEM